MLDNNGKPYTTTGALQIFDPTGPQLKLFNLWDQTAIRAGGSPIYYYETFIPTGEIDTDYWEARGKLFSNNPVELWASYEPAAYQNYMNQFGTDSLNEMTFECNADAVIKAIGHPPKIGSRIHTPHMGGDWELIQTNAGEFRGWGVLRLLLICNQWQETVTTAAGKVTEKSPNIPKPL